MDRIDWIHKRHYPYQDALQKITRFMLIVSGDIDDEPPVRKHTIDSLTAALRHLANRADCPICSVSRGLQDDELAFLSVYESFSKHLEYHRRAKKWSITVCLSDTQDEETVGDPFYCIAVFLGRKRLDGIGTSIRATVQKLSRTPVRGAHGGG